MYERETEKDIQTERQKETDRHTETERQKDRECICLSECEDDYA